jgi:dUTP pyrophosphatase
MEGDAGMDLTAVDYAFNNKNIVTYQTGIAIEIPKGYVGLIFPRSSVSNYDLAMTNCVGVIDSGYRGELMVKFRLTTTSYESTIYKKGDRIAQLVIIPYPKIEFNVVDELTSSNRMEGGFGSTN